ncbi:cytochrome P450 [Bradyrhizobium sp. Tv2a-2]|uniref:cytochrome P450 n=1 Tax=Bradyrhizobium sp. Tv2a-2 TaxID=113395 RepID=UPI0009FEA2B2|nr:cytochrome P450 [Bradyrhizobium sp. Tv2a-2]
MRGVFRPPAPVPPADMPGLLRLLATLKRNPLECWSAGFFEQPIVRVRLPFLDPVLVHDPAAIKRVLVDNSANYRKDPIQRRILATGLADGLLSVEGQRWDVQRRTLAPLFARRTVTSFTDAMLRAADNLGNHWGKLKPGSIVDVAAEFTLLTLHVLALTIFSDGIGSNFDAFRVAMNDYFGAIGRISVLDLIGAPDYVPRRGRRRLRQTMAYFEGVIDEVIAARRRRLDHSTDTGAPDDLLALLLRALDPATGRPMSLAEVRANVLTFLSAGHETTANALAWAAFLLSQSPYWSARVRAEADAELDGDRNGLLERLVVTKAVVEEALRLYPSIAALSRVPERAEVIGEISLQPQSLIVIAPYILHRHRRLWEQPDLFDPTRFLGAAKAKIPRFAYLPFGAGPRTCIGSSFALQEATLVLARLVQRFDMQLVPGAKVWPLQKITLRPGYGLPMRITPRSNARHPPCCDCQPG